MNKAVADDYEEIVDLGKVESISNVAMEVDPVVEEGNDLGLANSEEGEESFDAISQKDWLTKQVAAFNVPLSIFHYKDYNSDFFTSWYNMSSEILKEINRACPEKKVLNLALSVLMLPYIAFTALGLVVYSRLNSKKQEGVGEDKTKKSETSVPKRLAYGALAEIAIFVNVTVLVTLVVPATIALATFYLLNRDLSHSLVAALKISMGQYSNKHQNIEVSFHETEVSESRIEYDMEIKFPPQFKKLLRDLCENENNKWFSVTRDSEHNIILKLSTNINLKNGLKPLRNEINDVLTTSIKELAKAMEELMKLEKKDITHDKLKELLNEFRLKVVSSIGSKLTTHLIENAYQVAFIQAIKFAQKRKKDFSLEDALRDMLVKQELESQGKELPTEREMIIKDLKELLLGDDIMELLDNADDISDDDLLVLKARWKQFIEEDDIDERKVIDIYKGMYPKETEKALDNAKIEIECLEKEGQKRYIRVREKLKEVYDEEKNNFINDDLEKKLEDFLEEEEPNGIYEKLKEIYENIKGNGSTYGVLEGKLGNLLKEVGEGERHEKLKEIYEIIKKNSLAEDNLRRRLEGLFKFEYDNQEVKQRLVKSVMRKAKDELSQLGILSLIEEQFVNLEKKIKASLSEEALDEVNDFVEKVYLEITKCKMLNLFRGQAKSMKGLCDLLKEDKPELIESINTHRIEIAECLEQRISLKEEIEENENLLNKDLEGERIEEEEPDLVQRINAYRAKIAKCLEQRISLKEEIEEIEENENLNKDLEGERKEKGEEHPNTKLIEKHFKNNQEILKVLEQLELEKEGLLINEKTINDYREELESREKIKFAIIEDDLLKAFKHEIFDEEAIKKLLEKAELEYYLAEKCIKSPVIKTKNNIKHFCQDLLSPLMSSLADLIINNMSKDNDGLLTKCQRLLGVVRGWIQLGAAPFVSSVPLVRRIYDQNLNEVLKTGRNVHNEAETFLQHFQSSYEEVETFLGNLFSDDGETFKNDVWPKVEEHLHGMWDRFFKNIEFKIGNKLDEVNVTQQNQETGVLNKPYASS